MNRSIKLYNNYTYQLLSVLITFATVLPQLFLIENQQYLLSIAFLLIYLILAAHFSKIVFFIFVFITNILTAVQLHIAIHWGGSADTLSSRVSVAMISPGSETTEYLTTYLDYKDYLIANYTLLVIIFSLIFLLNYKNNLTHFKKTSLLFAIIIILIIQNQKPLRSIKESFSISNRSFILSERDSFLKENPILKEHNTSLVYNKIIIVQGESANKHFMNIYGYDKQTTPYLSQLLNDNKLYVYNAIASSNQTRFAIPTIYTDAEVNNWEEGFTHSISLLSKFKEYGYRTQWISNQGIRGKNEDYVVSIAKEADKFVFLNIVYPEDSHSDIVIKKYLDTETMSKNKEMTVFHLTGSHFHYAARYTQDGILNSTPSNTIEAYENTIKFTDDILKSIVAYYQRNNNNLLLIYLSDHGEVVSNIKHGHGFNPPFKDEYEIPFVIYSSIKNPKLTKLLADNKKGSFNAESFNNIIKYISGISIENKISYSTKVLSISLDKQYDYKMLPFYNNDMHQ